MYRKVEEYIQNELRGSELMMFEDALSNDPELRTEYEFRKNVDSALQENDIMELRDQLDTIVATTHHNSISGLMKVMKHSKKWIAAASITLLLTIGGGVFYHLHQPLNKDEIFDEYYKPYEATVAYRSANAELNGLLAKGFEAYRNKNFSRALTLFQKVLNQREDIAARMYSGISYIEVEKYRQANNSFSKVVNDKDNLFVEQAKWYMSICYVKIGDFDRSLYLLEDLKSESLYYRNQSEKLILKLKQLKEES